MIAGSLNTKPFFELPLSPSLGTPEVAVCVDERTEPFWSAMPKNRGIESSTISVSVSHLFLASMIQEPKSALSDSEIKILKATKSFEKKTQFYLSYPGAAMIITAAVASAVAGGASFYYGVNQAPLDSLQVASYMGLSTLVGSLASNMLSFYITGTLPNNASEAENKEQNMWDAFTRLKAEPAAYQLIEWYSPLPTASGSQRGWSSRRQIAQVFVESLNFEHVIAAYKSMGTQHEKIELAFRALYEAKLLIEAQRAFEQDRATVRPSVTGLMTHALIFGYFKGD
jgi:hypothetical protein